MISPRLSFCAGGAGREMYSAFCGLDGLVGSMFMVADGFG